MNIKKISLNSLSLHFLKKSYAEQCIIFLRKCKNNNGHKLAIFLYRYYTEIFP